MWRKLASCISFIALSVLVSRSSANAAPPASKEAHVAKRAGARPAGGKNQQRGKGRRVARRAYRSSIGKWHRRPKRTEDDAPIDPLALSLDVVNTKESVVIHARTPDGGFSSRELERLTHALRDSRTGHACPVSPRLAAALLRIQHHFHAPMLRIVSGYRTPRARPSNHGLGRAADVIVPGTSDLAVARFARTLGLAGVGLYPTSGFVHIDVRSTSYFWVDSSGPGRRGRAKRVARAEEKKRDRAALERGERPVPSGDEISEVEVYERTHATRVPVDVSDEHGASDDER